MQRPAVLSRERLGGCKHTEPPCSLDERLSISATRLRKAAEVKRSLWPPGVSKTGFLLGLVQVARETESYNVVEKHRLHIRGIWTLSKSQTKIYSRPSSHEGSVFTLASLNRTCECATVTPMEAQCVIFAPVLLPPRVITHHKRVYYVKWSWNDWCG